jgi:hypothetical protein
MWGKAISFVFLHAGMSLGFGRAWAVKLFWGEAILAAVLMTGVGLLAGGGPDGFWLRILFLEMTVGAIVLLAGLGLAAGVLLRTLLGLPVAGVAWRMTRRR